MNIKVNINYVDFIRLFTNIVEMKEVQSFILTNLFSIIQGVISVSPLTDKFGDFNSRFEFAHRLSLISDEMYEVMKIFCTIIMTIQCLTLPQFIFSPDYIYFIFQSTEKTCNGNYVSLYNDLDSIRCSNNLQWVDEVYTLYLSKILHNFM